MERMKLNKSVINQLKHMCATKMDQHFTHIHRALKIATAIALTLASCERSFSALIFVKNLLLFTITDERLTVLAVGQFKSGVGKLLKVKGILALFSSKGNSGINI